MAKITTGDRVYVSPKSDPDYYSGEGVLKAIKKLKMQSTPTGAAHTQTMMAVLFAGKGTIWVDPVRVKKSTKGNSTGTTRRPAAHRTGRTAKKHSTRRGDPMTPLDNIPTMM